MIEMSFEEIAEKIKGRTIVEVYNERVNHGGTKYDTFNLKLDNGVTATMFVYIKQAVLHLDLYEPEEKTDDPRTSDQAAGG